MKIGRRSMMLVLTVCTGIVLIAACSRHPANKRTAEQPPPRAVEKASRPVGEAPRLLRPNELTQQERKFGISPTRNSSVTYQPDVVIVENGSQAIRGISDNGLVWRVEAAAVPEQEIRKGRIVFLTSRAVGRVLDVRKQDGELAIMLGPVTLTEVIRDCDLAMEQPVNFGDALTYSVPDLPGAAVEVEPLVQRQSEPAFRSAVFTQSAGERAGGWLPVQTGRIEPFTTQPIMSLSSLGVRVKGGKGRTNMIGETVLHLRSPRLHFKLIISKGELMVAKLELHGAAGLTMGFTALSEQTGPSAISERVQVPEDLSIPVGGPLPFVITVRQQFLVKAVFGAPGTLQAQGDYLFGGKISVGYDKPAWDIGAPASVSGQDSLLASVEGVSLAPGALTLTHQIKVIGGFGAFGFVVGPYVFISSNVNVARFGDLDVLGRCIFGGFNLDAGTGVGYVIPKPITNAINFVLRSLNLGEIAGEGGLPGPRKHLVEIADVIPKKDLCTDALAEGKAPKPAEAN